MDRGSVNNEKERRNRHKASTVGGIITGVGGVGGHLEDADTAAYQLITGSLEIHILAQGSF